MPECLHNMHAHLTADSLGNSWSKTNLDETVCIETIGLDGAQSYSHVQFMSRGGGVSVTERARLRLVSTDHSRFGVQNSERTAAGEPGGQLCSVCMFITCVHY
jgi:hypothetical protein